VPLKLPPLPDALALAYCAKLGTALKQKRIAAERVINANFFM
jgi:hypothetical protein